MLKARKKSLNDGPVRGKGVTINDVDIVGYKDLGILEREDISSNKMKSRMKKKKLFNENQIKKVPSKSSALGLYLL